MADRVSPRPTLDEVAARAGVGRGTVSRVINGGEQVSPRAKAAVERAIAELGYVPNRAARSLVTRRSDSVALVVSESEERFFAEPFFAQIVRGVSQAVAATDLQLLLMMAHSEAQHRKLEHYLAAHHVDGVLLLSLHGDDPLPARLEKAGIPTVLCGRRIGRQRLSYVDADNAGGAKEAVEHMIRTGRRRIATICGPQDMHVGVARLDGYHTAMRDAGLEPIVASGDFSENSGVDAAERLLAEHSDLDAVFAASDPMAAGALQVLKAHGRRVPDDVALIGFDDSAIAEHTTPPLTSVHQPIEAMGQEMIRLLRDRISGASPRDSSIILETKLVVRASS